MGRFFDTAEDHVFAIWRDCGCPSQGSVALLYRAAATLCARGRTLEGAVRFEQAQQVEIERLTHALAEMSGRALAAETLLERVAGERVTSLVRTVAVGAVRLLFTPRPKEPTT